MKEYGDIFLSRGQNITNEKILNHMLNGFYSNYDLIVVMLNFRPESKFDKPTLCDV